VAATNGIWHAGLTWGTADLAGGLGDNDEVDVAVFRFTLGIPGFDDSNIPRVVGLTTAGLAVLNHLVVGNVSSAQASCCVGCWVLGAKINHMQWHARMLQFT